MTKYPMFFCLVLILLFSFSAEGVAGEIRPTTLLKLERHNRYDYILDAAISKNGNLVVTGHDSGALRMWDVKAKKCTVYRKAGPRINKVAIDSRSHWIAAVGRRDNVLYVYNVMSKDEIRKTLKGKSAWSVRFSPNGKYLVTATDTTIQLWELPTLRALGVVGAKEYAVCPRFSPNGKTLATDGSGVVGRKKRRIVKLWDTETRKLLAVMPMPDSVRGFGWCDGMEFLPDGDRLIILWNGLPNAVMLMDLKKQKQIWRLAIKRSMQHHLALSPNAKIIAISDANRKASVTLISVDKGEVLMKLPQIDRTAVHGEPVVFADNTRLLTAVLSTVYIWKLPLLKSKKGDKTKKGSGP